MKNPRGHFGHAGLPRGFHQLILADAQAGFGALPFRDLGFQIAGSFPNAVFQISQDFLIQELLLANAAHFAS